MRILRRVRGLAVLVVIAAAVPAEAQTSYPMVMSTHPVAVPAGATTEVTVEGRYDFRGAYQVLFAGEGVSAEIVPAEPKAESQPEPKRHRNPAPSGIRLRVTVAPDAALGVRDFRIATRQGVSSIGQLAIVEGQALREEELAAEDAKGGASNPGGNKTDGPTPAAGSALVSALPITLPPPETALHISGRIGKNEEIDRFRFSAQAGEPFTFVVLCKRLQDKIHDLQKHADPILFVKDGEGRELASSDNYFFSDPMLHWRCEKAGDYLLELRDVRYAGDERWTYALSILRGPLVLNVFPLAASPGQKVEVTPFGLNLGQAVGGAGGGPATALEVPATWEAGVRPIRLPGSANPVPLVVSDLPQVFEAEANNSADAAQPITLPAGVNGRLLAEGDIDRFSFEAKKGQRYTFEVIARRLMNTFGWYANELDSHLAILDAQGQELASDDDSVGKDSRLDWTAPADGTFVVQVRDLNLRGGEAFVYYLTAEPAQPDFALYCDGDKAMLGPGSHTVWFVRVDRRNGFAGPVKLRVDGLPAGVTATCGTIEPHMTQASVILSAAWDAPIGAANVRVVGTAPVTDGTGTAVELARVAQPREEIYVPGGGRALYGVDLHTVSVTERSDLVQLVPSRQVIRLKPGESTRIDLNVKRRPDFKDAVTIDLQLQHLGTIYGNPLPPGVSIHESASKLRLGPADADHPEGETRAHVVLKATPDAKPVENVPLAVMGYVSINFVVKVGYSTPPIRLSVEGK